MTALQSSFSVNNIALVHGRPKMLNLKDMIKHFVDHRHEVVTRRTQYDLNEAEKRAHILQGLIIACDNIDRVIAIIRSSQSPDEARERLMQEFELSDIQSRAIVEMRLRQLTGLEMDKLRNEYEALMLKIAWYKGSFGKFGIEDEHRQGRVGRSESQIRRCSSFGNHLCFRRFQSRRFLCGR